MQKNFFYPRIHLIQRIRDVDTHIYHVWFLSGLLADALNQGKMSRAQVDLPQHGATFSKNR